MLSPYMQRTCNRTAAAKHRSLPGLIRPSPLHSHAVHEEVSVEQTLCTQDPDTTEFRHPLLVATNRAFHDVEPLRRYLRHWNVSCEVQRFSLKTKQRDRAIHLAVFVARERLQLADAASAHETPVEAPVPLQANTLQKRERAADYPRAAGAFSTYLHGAKYSPQVSA